ncbi:MAG: hypothetical protein RBT75_07955 [Anaerolineae bacterium]|jgi:hypothetical protein|nr:hypothetical protein [Anaerolineae bacterium]
MANDGGRGAAGPAPRGGLKARFQGDWTVPALSAAGVCFIILGLVAFALPATYEGELLVLLTPNHSLRVMDVAGAFAVGLGIVLTWLGGRLWQRQMHR